MSNPKLNERLAFTIHQLSAQMARICNPIFRRYHVDQISAQILILTAEQEGIAVGEIVASLKLPQSTVSHQIKRLEHHRYLTRQRDPVDQRVIRLELTATGRLVADACDTVSQEVYRAMVGDMDVATMTVMKEAFAKMLTRLEAVHAAGTERRRTEAAAARPARYPKTKAGPSVPPAPP